MRLLSGYDAIIEVGGSFFVDLYGVPQFEHALCTFMAKKPLFMIGHSVGPFQMSNLTNWRTTFLVTATR